jgi:hypothetical protein
MSVTQRNSAMTSLRVSQLARVLCANQAKQARARARFPYRGPARARLSPLLFMLSFFLFLPDLGNS